MVVARLLDKTYTMSIHAGNDIFANPVLLSDKINGARHVVTCTSYNKSYLENLAHENVSDKVTFIPHGLDLTLYEPRPKIGGISGIPRILSVGTLTERKGFVHLIRACHGLRNRGHKFVCNIVGDGEQREDLEKLIGELSLENSVVLLGALRHEEVIEQYQHATLFVLPCIQSTTGDLDGIPNVVAEAMAMGLPVVSSRISGVPELVEHEISGLLVGPGDEPALTDAMERLLNEPTTRETLGQMALRRVHQEFEVEKNTQRLAATLWPNWFSPTATLAITRGDNAS
jgi:glycosyltransferase involved in cell wall biosynthesis